MSKNRKAVFSLGALAKLAAGLCLILVISGTGLAVTYSCGDPSSAHCYARVRWQEKPEYFGAYVDVNQVPMACPGGCGGFIDDELWLVDDHSGGCTANPFGMCWVEAGAIALDGANNPVYFWADSRPMKTNTFNLHLLGPTDAVGVTDHYMLIKDARNGAGVFQVWLYNDSLSTLYNGTSTSNAMSGNSVHIGQELAGTKDASVGDANFTRNIWAVQALGPEFVFWYNRQTTQGDLIRGKPPFGSWTINPSSPPPPEGGQFTTHCCS